MSIFFFNDTATTEIYTLSLHDARPICPAGGRLEDRGLPRDHLQGRLEGPRRAGDVRPRRDRRLGAEERQGRCEEAGHHRLRSEEHTSELQSRQYLVCRLLLEQKQRQTI